MTTGFIAPEKLRETLQNILTNVIDLSLLGKQAHWNVVGPNFRSLHLAFDDVVDIARDASDDFAERMRAIGGIPDGRNQTVASQSALSQFPEGEVNGSKAVDLIVNAIEAVVGGMRKVFDDVDEADPTTADLLNDYIAKFEQQAWFLASVNREA